MTNEAKHIVESGELEQYALGLLDAARSEQVQRVLRQDQDLQNELQLLRSTFESYAGLHAEQPKESMRGRVLDAAFAADAANNESAQPGISSHTTTSNVTSPGIQLDTARRYYRYAVAASVACLMTGSAAVYFWNESRSAQQRLEQTQQELALLKTNQQVLAARLDVDDTYLGLLSDESVAVVHLQATANAPSGSASVVLWNRHSHEVYLQARNLPANSATTDYQLWALLDGKPIDLGVYNSDKRLSLAQMKSIAKADAFAITLEPKGGSASPTLSQLYVMGKAG